MGGNSISLISLIERSIFTFGNVVSGKSKCFLNYPPRYNKVKRNSREVEFELVKDEVEEIDKLIQKGQKELNWNSDSKLIFYEIIQ